MNRTFTETLIIGSTVDKAFAAWSAIERFPEFMEHVLQVTRMESRSNWKVRGPFGLKFDWEAETTTFEPDKRIAWKAKGRKVENSGQVLFTGLPRGKTQITLTMHIATSGIGRFAGAHILADVKRRVRTDIGNFKKQMEGMTDRLTMTERTRERRRKRAGLPGQSGQFGLHT